MAIFREKTSQDLTSGSLSFTKGYAEDVTVAQIMLSASTDITETVTVNFISKDGAEYNVKIDESSLVNDADYVFRPAGRLILKKGDGIQVTCTNANTTGTVYVTIITETIP